MHITFNAPEYHADGNFRNAQYSFDGSADDGWEIRRDGRPHMRLPEGYRLLRCQQCGVCSTDLARRYLPFPLPQIIGHELIATDESGQRYVVEINASHKARGVADNCAFCTAGLPTHCPGRIVLGIHDLPGGFGPWILAPREAAIPVDDDLPANSLILVEPFAAALHAVDRIQPQEGDTIAVLGPRRLGMLVVAALRAYRTESQLDFTILALSRHPELLTLATLFGATDTMAVNGDGALLRDHLADVVIDTTGNADGLDLAVRLARREVHLKSTHGRPASGLAHLTECVVDEIGLARLEECELPTAICGGKPRVAWLVEGDIPDWLENAADVQRFASPVHALAYFEEHGQPLPRADAAVVDGAHGVDAALRPHETREISLVRPRGVVLIRPENDDGSQLLDAIAKRGLRLSTSRCGDFRRALALMERDPFLQGIGDKLITHRFPIDQIAQAFSVAGSPACIKAVIEHGVEA